MQHTHRKQRDTNTQTNTHIQKHKCVLVQTRFNGNNRQQKIQRENIHTNVLLYNVDRICNDNTEQNITVYNRVEHFS